MYNYITSAPRPSGATAVYRATRAGFASLVDSGPISVPICGAAISGPSDLDHLIGTL
jgi:hypothetical protein